MTMFNANNRIIIVDDEEPQLIELAKTFLATGIGCKTIWYNPTYNIPLTNVRVAFFDMNLTGKIIDLDQETFDYKKDKNLSSAFNDLTFAIQNCISVDNGPYALIFWSKHAKAFPNFIEYVNERCPDMPSPILINAMNKSDLAGKSAEEIQSNIEQFFKDKSISLLFDFESKCENAAIETVNEIIKIIPKNEHPEENGWLNNGGFEENFDLVFSTIAKATLGNEHAKLNTDRAVYEALLPMMNYKILCDSVNKHDWEQHLKSISNPKLEYPQGFSQGILNSIFHLDISSKIESSSRGAVFEYNFRVPFFSKILFSLIPYFETIEKEMNRKFAKFISFSDKISQEDKEYIRGHSQFVVIEISASCDYSQNKSRNHKYVLGLITPTIDEKYLDTEIISQSVFYKELPVFNISNRSEFILNNENFQIWINFNYVVSSFSKDKNFGKPLFILKKEIIDMIGNRYANHVSRIGITSF
jgi:hypothetical protein